MGAGWAVGCAQHGGAAVDLTVGRGRTASNTAIARIQFNGVFLDNKAGHTNVLIDAFCWFGEQDEGPGVKDGRHRVLALQSA